MRLRSVFVSDVHLGSKGCRADLLLEFLKSVEVENLYLVGDIFDLWAMRKGFFWPQEHNNVVRTILGKAKGGTRVIYIPGNHDEDLREFCGSVFGNLEIHREYVHGTADGRKLLVMHGDEFDSVVRYAKYLALLGDRAYSMALILNRWFNAVRRRLGYPYWSLSAWLKRQVKEAVKAVDRFEVALTNEARRRGYDGVVCGHIHHAEMRVVQGVMYLNDGDWVESCTALVEHHDGRLELIDWAAENRLSLFAPRRQALRAAA